jgi:hypothetical protein
VPARRRTNQISRGPERLYRASCAHTAPVELITKLVEAGFTTATTDALDVNRVKINDLGRVALKSR